MSHDKRSKLPVNAGGIGYRNAVNIDCSNSINAGHQEVDVRLRQGVGTYIELPLEGPCLGGRPPQDKLVVPENQLVRELQRLSDTAASTQDINFPALSRLIKIY